MAYQFIDLTKTYRLTGCILIIVFVIDILVNKECLFSSFFL